ncbi:PREDICTED: uncharacterized protein LOC105117603 isoform X1 [Populus euphratica]|uniref:Uncharacterized protein LOC105117603 isoform X1 n=1 Tax=Populus euphratica TaxID=75702 RepID=A0AAJ6TMM2_POPEU|nr:PREDICTED: uncharacterized protein LOC105117603 isoform X1 [Populus euphratica]
MAADVSVKKEATVNNPCCKVWKEKCGKLEEGRKCLRQAVKLLTEQADKFQAENVSLNKACEEERAKVEAAKEGREKEAALRVKLEKEISALQSEVSTLHQKGSAFPEVENTEVKLLQDQFFKGEKEISRLNELLERERLRADSEKKNAEVEKKSAAEAWKHVKAEKEGKEKEAALRVSLENEISALKSEISSLQQKGSMVDEDKNGEVKLLQDQVSKGEKEINRLKELHEREKTRAESEKKKAEVERKRAAEAWQQVKAEKAKAEEERKHASSEWKKAEEYRLQLETLTKEAELARSKLASETLKFEEANKKFEAEKIKVTKEKKHADSEMVKAEANRKLAEANWKKLMEEKSHTENICKQLEDARKRIEKPQKAEEYQRQLESLKKEAAESKSKLVAETLKLEDANKMLEAEKAKVLKERKRADSVVAKAKEQRKLAETNGRKVIEEKSRADNLSRQLEDARIKIEELEKGINGFIQSKNMGGTFDDQPDEITNGEDATNRDSLENLKNNSDQSKLVLEFLNYKEATKRLDIEKRKAITEKKHADSEMVKAEKLRNLSKMNRKIAAEEKSRADQLSRQLHEDKIKIEELQKQIQELQSSKKVVVASSVLPDKVMNVEKTKLKFLEKQVKLEKMRLRHAKVVAKMEKNRNSFLQQELARLKLDFGQMLFRLDVLDRYFSSSDGGTEKMEKFGNHGTMQRSKLNRKLCAEEQCQMYSNNESELLKPSCMALAVSEHPPQTLHCTVPLVSPSSGNYAASISGIDSKLESLLGGSNQKLLQTSAINSSSASFSDGQLVGSQEGGPSFPTSKNLVEDNFRAQTTISGISDEVTEVQHNENLAVVADNSVRSPHSFDVIGRVNSHGRKRRILDAVESVELLYSEGKKLHLQMEEKLSALHGMLNRQIEKPQEEAKYVESNIQGGSYGKHGRIHKKRKISHEENVIVHCLSGIDQPEKTEIAGKEVHEDANACGYISATANNLLEASKACREGFSYSFESSPEGMVSFEEVANGDYMKLLDLDNTADEECYRRAMEITMSPILPEIGSSGAEISDNMDNFKPLLDESFPGSLPNGKESLVPSFRLDVIDAEISSKQLKDCSFGISCADVLHENGGHADSLDTLGNRSGTGNAVDAGKASDGQTRGPGLGLEIEMLNIPSSRYEGLKFPIEGEPGSRHDNIPKYCVMHSDMKDSISMSRVLSATRTCMTRCSLDTQAVCLVQKILCALKMEENSLPKEKACTFFTLLLLNFSACNWGQFGSFSDPDFLFCLDSFAKDIFAVVSDVEARNLFAEVCCLDELLGLIEEFLLDGKLMIYVDLSSESLSGCDSIIDILLDGVNIKFASKSASADLLVGGSIILASICAAIDCTGFLCQASYSLLLMHKCDTVFVLTILHIFAYLAGEKFFFPREHNLTMTVLKSIIMFLEGGDSPDASAASSPTRYNGGMFHPCAKCPFSTDAVSIDTVTSVLLEKLQNCAVSGIMHHPMKSPSLSNSNVLCCKDTAKLSLNQEEVDSALDMNCDTSCSLKKCVMPARSNYIMNETLCGLSDLLSLVELLACNMSWEWTCSKIIPELLEMLEKTELDNFAAAVVILLGQLGRLGVSAFGYEDNGVENLRCKLSGFLSRDATIRMALPVQIALATALLGLLSLDFEKLIRSNSCLTAMSRQSVSIDHIRSWFSSLTKEQQALSLSLLPSSDVR